MMKVKIERHWRRQVIRILVLLVVLEEGQC